jgi:phosphoribosylformylglycinamidine (FGAM) synthase-like amidotransferase family enzyme
MGHEKGLVEMMPHPKRCAEKALGNEDGRLILALLVEGVKRTKVGV